MNEFLTEEIELCGADMSQQDSDSIGEAIYEAMLGKGIFCDSFSWSVNVEYSPQEEEC
tara:strand:+ start:1899 stop:2072 length:174 start_codon:yes stop_codon:yes gene_type:complete